MYTVFRITRQDSENLLSELIEQFDSIEFELCKKNNATASCYIHNGSIWAEHCEKIKEFIVKFSEVLNKKQNCETFFHLDVAIWHEDMKGLGARCLICDLELLKVLCENNASIEFSFYTG